MELGVWTKQLLITLISYVVVDERDPAFQDPTKPIGPVLSREQGKDLPYPTREVPGGLRRVVASPKPVTVVEKREIKRLVDKDFIVICCGGGGIPVIREGRAFHGVDAVIDKDLASAKLAEEIRVDVFLIATVTLAEAAQYMAEGHFPPGSMGPKIEAAVQFIKKRGNRAVITSIGAIESAVAGTAGTEIVGDGKTETK
jgi:carbamate kinase